MISELTATLENLPPALEGRSGWPWTQGSIFAENESVNILSWPKISIVTPSLNQGRFLEQAIRSVLLQGYPALEYVIIDGGSKDNSLEIIKKYEPYLTYWVSEPDNGHGHALNKGFAHTGGEIMAWLNSDDMYTPNAFTTVAQIFSSHPNTNWLVGRNAQWDKNDRLIKTKPVYKNIYDYLSGHYRWIEQESVFWRRSLWKRAGSKIDESYRLMVDGELWCRFFLLDDLWHADQCLGGYRVHEFNRGHLEKKRVIREMEMATRKLKSQCPKEWISKSNSWGYLKSLLFFLEKIGLENWSHQLARMIDPKFHYKKLVYAGGKWIKSIA